MDHCIDSTGSIRTIEIWLVDLVLAECAPVARSHPGKVSLVSQSAGIAALGASVLKSVKSTTAYENVGVRSGTVIIRIDDPVFVLIPLQVWCFRHVEIWVKV